MSDLDLETSSEMTSVKTSMVSCSMCGENPAKYRCPRCFVETCCLFCVKQHKIVAACSGVRDKTSYVAVKHFTDTNLLNDYRFLEEGGRKADNACRDFLSKTKSIPRRFHLLVRQARIRGIDLQLLPFPMTRRKINSSYYMFKTKQIMWHLVWCFPQAGETFTDKLVKESIPLEEQLQKYLHPTKSDPVKRHKLHKYVNAGVESCHLYLRVECLPANMIRFHRLDAHKSITDNLMGKSVVEFPKIFVLIEDSDSAYKVITKEEEEKHCQSARKYSDKMKKQHNSKSVSTEPEQLQHVPTQHHFTEVQSTREDSAMEVQTTDSEISSIEAQTNAGEVQSIEAQTNASQVPSIEAPTNAGEVPSIEAQTNEGEVTSIEAKTNASEVTSIEAPTVGDVTSIEAQTNTSEVSSIEAPTVGDVTSIEAQTNASEVLSIEAPTVGDATSTEAQTNASEVLSIEAQTVGKVTSIQGPTNALDISSNEAQTNGSEVTTVESPTSASEV